LKQVFEFSSIYRLWGGIMIALALILGLLFAVFLLGQPHPPADLLTIAGLVAASCGLFITIGLYLFVAWSGKLILTDQTITWTRFNRQLVLHYHDILRVQYGAILPFLVIATPNGQIAINKQIENYDKLYSLLQKYVPVLHDAAKTPLPLETTARLGDLIGYSALSLLPLALAVMIGRSPTRYTSSLALAVGLSIVLVSMTAALLYHFLLKPPFRYTFTARQITTQSLLGKRIFDATLSQSIRMDKTITTRWGVDRAIYSIVIEFSDGRRLAIEQDTIRYPLEQLLGVLQHHYETTPDASVMRLTNSS
jgi:hypothetical protein